MLAISYSSLNDKHNGLVWEEVKIFSAHATHCHGNHLDNFVSTFLPLYSSNLQLHSVRGHLLPPSHHLLPNYSVVDMELTPTGPSSIHTRKRQPPPPSQSPPSTNYSVVDMELTPTGPSSIHTRKRQLEPEEDQVPEEFQPLAVSTPNVSCYLKFATAWKIFS